MQPANRTTAQRYDMVDVVRFACKHAERVGRFVKLANFAGVGPYRGGIPQTCAPPSYAFRCHAGYRFIPVRGFPCGLGFSGGRQILVSTSCGFTHTLGVIPVVRARCGSNFVTFRAVFFFVPLTVRINRRQVIRAFAIAAMHL